MRSGSKPPIGPRSNGEPLDGGLDVLNNGAVHYHGLPQYAVASALDVLRLVIDHFGTEPPARDELGEFR